MHLIFLPPETLLQILSYLPFYDTECLAQTFNKALTPTCLRSLRFWLPAARNSRRMAALFGEPYPFDRYGNCSRLYPENAAGWYPDSSSIPQAFSLDADSLRWRILDYLCLNRSLVWLDRVYDQSSARKLSDGRNSEPNESEAKVLRDTRLAQIKHTAGHLGFAIPPAFERFMTDSQLRGRMSVGCSEFVVGSLFKVTSSRPRAMLDDTQRTINGYMCCIDLALDWFGYLYMDTHGGHCVVSSSYDLTGEYIGDEERDGERKIKQATLRSQLTETELAVGCTTICDLDDYPLRLIASSLEEHIIAWHFSNWAYRRLPPNYDPARDGAEFPARFRDFLMHLYSE